MARLGRAYSYPPHLARPVLGRAPTPHPVVIGQAVQRGWQQRFRYVPRTITPPPVSAAPTFLAPPATIVLQAVQRAGQLVRRSVPKVRIATPIVATPIPTATIVTNQSVGRGQRAFAARLLPLRLVVPQAIIARGPPVAPALIISDQALGRALTRRAAPPPHLAEPVAAVTFLAPPATIVSNHLLRRPRRATPPSTILPPPVAFMAPVARQASVVSLGAVERSRRRRFTNGTILPPPLAGRPPVPAGTFVGLGPAERIRRRRHVSTVLVAPPVLSRPFLAPPAVVVSEQATERALTRRGVPAPHLAPPVPSGRFVAPLATIVSDQSLQRALTRRTVPGPHLAELGATPPVRPGTFTGQALRRPYVGRAVPPPRLAKPIVTSVSAFRSVGFLNLQAIERALVGRGGHVRLPALGARPPVPAGSFFSQALRRPYVGRQAAKTLHTGPVVSAPVPFRSAGFLNLQAVQRSQERRFRDVVSPPRLAPRVPFPQGPGATLRLQAVVGRALLGRGGHVRLPRLGAPQPVPRGTLVFQALSRPYVGRSTPAPHLARPVAPSTFVAPPALIVAQAMERGWQTRARTVPPPHLAPRVTSFAGPGATIKLQAQARQLRRREGRALLPKLGASRPVPRGVFVSQATERPYVGRRVPSPHLASALVTTPTFPPNAPGTFVSQAIERASSLVSRRGHVKLAPPALAAPKRPGTLVVSQALQRPYVGRKIIPPHLAQPVRAKAGPGASLHYQAVQRALRGRSVPLRPRLAKSLVRPPAAPLSAVPIVFYQAIDRAYLGRKVPPSPSLRYHPITFVPSQPVVPFPPITAAGVTGGFSLRGQTNPRSNPAQTSPTPQTGQTHPKSTPGVTSPQERNP